jgi:hypothetical protein
MTIQRQSTTASIQKNLDLLDGLQNAHQKAHQKAQKSLLPFTLYTKPDYRPNWHHAELAQHLFA